MQRPSAPDVPSPVDEQPIAPTRLSRLRVAVLLVAVTLLALGLRWTGIGFMLPHVPQVDEQILYYQVRAERGLDPPSFKRELPFAYPTLIAKTASAILPRATECDAQTIDEHLECAKRDLVNLRILLALVATLGVPLTFVLARRFAGDGIALIAAFFLATSVLHGWYSPQARPHAVVCTLTLVAVVAAIDLRRNPSARTYLVAGLATALAAGSLQSGLLVTPVLVVAHLLRRGNGPRWAWLWFALAWTLVFASIAVFYRHNSGSSEADGNEHLGLLAQIMHKVHGVQLSDFDGSGFGASAEAIWNYEPLIGLLALGGFLALVVRTLRRQLGERAQDLAVVLGHVVPHLVAFGLFSRTFQRFLMPIVPYLCVLAAWTLVELVRVSHARADVREKLGTPVLACLSLIVALQTTLAFKLTWLRSRSDTSTLAATWIRAHVDREHENLCLAASVDLPLVRKPEGIPAYQVNDVMMFTLWPFYEVALPPETRARIGYDVFLIPLQRPKQRTDLQQDPAAFVRALDANYVAVEVSGNGYRVALEILRNALRFKSRPIARFGPVTDPRGDEIPILYQLDGPLAREWLFAWRALWYSRLGPEIEIYATPRE